jgi:ubiquinone/menaquinone biosynthesis C-methylase UbiE
METKFLLAAGLAGVLASGALAGDAPGAGEGLERRIALYEDESRREWQKPIEVLETLGIIEGSVVADIGAGTGYFTGLLSIQVGEGGRVYAVDIDQAMLDHIATRHDVAPDRVEYVLARPDDPRLPAGEIDLIVLVNTWHHIPKRPKYLQKLAAALSPAGRVAIIDFHAGELPVGPPPGDKVGRDTVVAEFEKAKWTLAAESVMLPYQYFLVFHPPK